MKKIVSFFLLIGFVFAASAQKIVNDANAEKRSVSGYTGIEVATGIKLYLSEGTTEEVAVSASKTEFRDKIMTKVENGILKIHYESKMGSINKKEGNKELKAYVSYKTLDKLTVTTGAEVEIDGILKASSLDITANTGAIVKGEVNITDLEVEQNTGSKITLTGSAEDFSIEGDTGSKFYGEDMSTTSCDIKVSTGARVWITAKKELQVKANTGGAVKYKGDASVREIKTSTGGSVQKIKAK
ncbi:MAG: DUF2807 domain-containing protein [Chitinophagaceae bacterium]|nr:DUF2807 domain-containing protein [Chitinophagaceae bacterium]